MSRTGAFKRRYTVAQTAAIVAAQVDHKLSAPQAIDAAAKGTLPAGAWGQTPEKERTAFVMPEATARSYAGEERQRRRHVERARSAPDEVLARSAARTSAILERELDALETKQRRGQRVAGDVGGIIRLQRELAALVRSMGPVAPRAPAGPEAVPDTDDFVGSLAAAG